MGRILAMIAGICGAIGLSEHNITVNGYAPGVVVTPLWEQLDKDLVEIGKAAKGLPLITGGSGVALGLPGNFGCTASAAAWTGQAGKSVALSGSCSVATRAQIACDDGQEAHLKRLGNYIDKRIAELVASVGQIGDARLLVMASLLIADEMSDAYSRLEAAEDGAGSPRPPPGSGHHPGPAGAGQRRHERPPSRRSAHL